MKKYTINQTAGDNSVQIIVNGNVVGDINIFRQFPNSQDLIMEFHYKGTKRELEFDDDTIAAFNAWYALPPGSDFKVYVKEAATGKVNSALSRAVKQFLTFMKQDTFAPSLIKNYLRSYEVQADMYAHNYNFENDAEKQRFVQFVFCCVTISKIIKPCEPESKPNAVALCGYIYKPGVLDYHFPINIEKDILKEFCDNSKTIDYSKLTKVDCPDYYVLWLGAGFVGKYVLPSYFLWLCGIDDIVIKKHAEILDLCNYKLSAR